MWMAAASASDCMEGLLEGSHETMWPETLEVRSLFGRRSSVIGRRTMNVRRPTTTDAT
jgi:hypothetical protein